MKKLDDVFDIEPFDRTEIISQSGDVIVPDQGSTDKNIDYDYEKTRSNLHSLLQQGQDALYHVRESWMFIQHRRQRCACLIQLNKSIAAWVRSFPVIR